MANRSLKCSDEFLKDKNKIKTNLKTRYKEI